MALYKLMILGLVLATLYSTSTAQLSFSTSWGSGKRSGGFQARPQDLTQAYRPQTDDVSICLSQLQYTLMKEVNALLRREIKQASRCLLGSKEVDYE